MAAQIAGAIGGSVLANAMFEAGTSISTKERATTGHLLGEVVATAGLVLLIFALAATNRGALAAPGGGRLHRGGVLVHVLDLVREPGRDRRAASSATPSPASHRAPFPPSSSRS